MSHRNHDTSMGDAFMQRRNNNNGNRARGGGGGGDRGGDRGGDGGGDRDGGGNRGGDGGGNRGGDGDGGRADSGRPPSFLEIQAEQQQQSRHRPSNDQRRSGGGGDRRGFDGDDRRSGGGGDRRGFDGDDRRGGGADRRGGNDRRGGGFDDRRGGGGDRRRSSRRNDRSHLPLEQGCICSIKDSFGFIYCADREEEMFFHFSEVQNCHPADLGMDDEVEFRVGTSGQDDKMRAFELNRLEQGTIVWETEEDPGHKFQGIVEKPIRTDRGGKVQSEGVIRLLVAEEEQTEEAAEKPADAAVVATGPMVRFTPNDYQPASSSSEAKEERSERSFRRSSSTATTSSSRGGRLGVNDLVEFTLITSRRNQTKYARSIQLIQSDRERQRILREEKLLEAATLEQGVVTSLKNDFGFLRSNKRRGEVYFHYTNVELDGDDGGEEDDDEQELKIGQEMEFLVVTEEGNGNRSKEKKMSARRVKFLPAGSVEFETIVATGVTGIVTRCPHPADSGYSNDMVGAVRLSEGIKDTDDEGNERTVEEIHFYSKDSPGGTFSLREGAIGLWVREGDTLLFDVAKESIDGALAVFPTKKQVGEGNDDAQAASVKLVSCALAGRTEGVINVLKDAFGFIHCAERPVDSYFRLYEVFPKDLHRDLLRGMGVDNKDMEMQAGSEIRFDLSIQRNMSGNNTRPARNERGGRGRGSGGPQETLKAQRVLLLPPGSIVQNKILASDVTGVVDREDSKQSFAGTIELAEELAGMTLKERHPLVSKLVMSMLENKDDQKSLVFPDVQSQREDDVVMDVVEALSKGALTCSYLPVAGQKTGGRLRVSWTNDEQHEVGKSEANGNELDDGVDATKTSSETADGTEGAKQETPNKKKKTKKKRKPKIVKSLRYDKHCLAKEFVDGLPPGVGDKVVCDVVQSRRTGVVQITNVRIVERQEPSARAEMSTEPKASGIGIVSEVVSARQFGFVSLLDEGATKREVLFFHFKHVISNAANGGDADTKKGMGIRKGDETRFQIAVQKGGKRTAVNIEIVPRGTLDIPSKAAKNACHGLVLMVPSHSSLKDTPDRKARSRPTSVSPMRGGISPKRGGVSPMRSGISPKRGGVGRFGNVDLNEGRARNVMAKEEGCILLTEDAANMFSKPVNKKEPVTAQTSADSDTMDAAIQEKKEAESAPECALCTHIPYKQGAIAFHGVGSTSVADATANGPRRGDLVSFVNTKSGGNGARDVRVTTRGAATLVRGRLEQITVDLTDPSQGTAVFVAATEKEESYPIQLKEVVSCDIAVLKDKEAVEGLLHEGTIYGVCRTKDLFLESKLGGSHKERPKLNLTVRKGLGGKIMAQSMMAKGPDGTNGFVAGWTTRVSEYAAVAPDTGEADS